MDLNLSLSYQEQNDNKAIILTDTTDNFNSSTTHLTSGDNMVDGDFYEIAAATSDFTTYGAPDSNVGTRFVGNGTFLLTGTDDLIPVTPTIAEIDTMTLDTTVTGIDEVAVVKDQVDLISEFGPFTVQDDLVYTITSLLLGDASGADLPDGLYQLTYTLAYSGDGVVNTKTDIYVVTILVYGIVKVATYEKLREIPVLYMCVDGCPSPEISEADLCGAYLSGIENSAYVAKTEELLSMLVTLNGIITNGSNITW